MYKIGKIIFFYAIVALGGCSRHDYFFIENSSIDNDLSKKYTVVSDRNNAINKLLVGHYISVGQATTFIIRNYDSGSIFSVDDESYEKITISLANYKLGEPVAINSHGVRFYYSRGASSFIRKGHGLYSDMATGTITILGRDDSTILAEVNIYTIAKPTSSSIFNEKTISFRKTITFKKKNIHDLVPWIGVPSDDLGNEVYP